MTFLKIAYITLFVIATLVTISIKPVMHKPLSVENLNFNIEDVKKADLSTEKDKKTIQQVVTQVATPEVKEVKKVVVAPNQNSSTKVKNIQVSNQAKVQQQSNWIFDENPAPTKKKDIKVEQPDVVKRVMNTVTEAEKMPKQAEVNLSKEEEELRKFERIMDESTKNPNKDLSLDEIKTVFNVLTSNKNIEIVPQQTKTLTEQEEIIAWNKWRANLQNRVMADSHVVAPLGTVFMFSCVVDKYGNISNINAWSTNPNYTAMAKRNVKPALAALQHQPILKFPQGTQRTSTVVAGSFIISTSDRFASPDDYSDYERIR